MRIMLLAVASIISINAFAQNSDYESASTIAHKLVNKCQAQTNQLGEIMSNADAGARYKFDPNTIGGQRSMDAYEFALENKDEVARQEYLTTSLSKCIRDASADVKRTIPRL